MYKVTANPHKNRVIVEFSDNFDYDTGEFRLALQNAVYDARSKEGRFDILVDWSQTITIPQSRTDSTFETFHWCVAHGMDRSASVVKTIVQRMQLKRVTKAVSDDDIFETRAQAETWLDQQNLLRQ